MTENLANGVSVHLTNSSGFVAQKSGPETNLRAPLARGDEKQVFFVRCNDKEKTPLGGVMAAVMDAARPPGSPRSLDGQPRRPGSGQLLHPTVPHSRFPSSPDARVEEVERYGRDEAGGRRL